jgi:hypothetical protein
MFGEQGVFLLRRAGKERDAPSLRWRVSDEAN